MNQASSIRKGNQGVAKVNKALFEKLKIYVRQSGIVYPLKEVLYIDSSKEEDLLIAKSDVKVFSTGSLIKSALLHYQGDYYFAVFGVDINSEDVPVTTFETLEKPIDAGLRITLLYEMDIPINKQHNAFEIYDDLLGEIEPNSEPYPVPPEDFFCYMGNCTILKVIDENPEDIDFTQHLGYFMSIQRQSTISFNQNIHEKFFNLFSSENIFIPHDLLLIAYSAFNYKHVFLELYRSFEYLFPIPALKDMKESLNITSSNSITLAKQMEISINWRPKEDESIKKLFQELDPNIIARFDTHKGKISELAGLDTPGFIYRLRNFNVHYRKALGADALSITDDTWQGLIEACLDAIDELYQKYETELTLTN